MADVERLLKTLERQQQILNELARICAQISEALLTGKLAECEKALKGETQ